MRGLHWTAFCIALHTQHTYMYVEDEKKNDTEIILIILNYNVYYNNMHALYIYIYKKKPIRLEQHYRYRYVILQRYVGRSNSFCSITIICTAFCAQVKDLSYWYLGIYIILYHTRPAATTVYLYTSKSLLSSSRIYLL